MEVILIQDLSPWHIAAGDPGLLWFDHAEMQGFVRVTVVRGDKAGLCARYQSKSRFSLVKVAKAVRTDEHH